MARRALLLIVCASACAEGPSEPAFGPPTELVVVSGDRQSATVAAALATPIVLRVVDAQGRAVPGATITPSPVTGSGTASQATLVTDAAGEASFVWTLGTLAGRQQLDARAGLTGEITRRIEATAIAGPPRSIAGLAGDAQTATVGAALPVRLAVVVRDTFANPVANAAVVFTVASGGGTLSGAAQRTDSAGAATLDGWTLGVAAGAQSVVASVGDTTSTLRVTFSATAQPGPAASVTLLTGAAQSVTVATSVPLAPSVVVRDAHGNPVPGVPVTFAVTAGGGSISGGATTTNAIGVASLGAWTLGTVAGSNALSATVSGLPPVAIGATGLAGPAATMVAHAGAGQTATVATAVATKPAVRIADAHGNAISSMTVTWVPACGTITGTATIATSAAGVSEVGGWTLGTSAGACTLQARAVGIAGVGAGVPTVVTFSATAQAGPMVFALVTPPSVTTARDVAFAQPAVVRIADSYGNPGAAGTVVSAAIAARPTDILNHAPNGVLPGTLVNATATTDATGTATFSALTMSGPRGSYSISFSAPSLTAVAAPVTLTWPHPAFFSFLVGAAHTCGLTNHGGAPGDVWCWGENASGQLGSGTTTSKFAAAATTGGLQFTALASGGGGNHSCALTAAGAAYCMGENEDGQLGDGTTTDRSTWTLVSGGHVFHAITVGLNFSCGLVGPTAGNTKAWCWGVDSVGQLGNGTTTQSSIPVQTSGNLVLVQIAAAVGGEHVCAREANETVWCWGKNNEGQIGDNSQTHRLVPTALAGLPALGLNASAVTAGRRHSCAVRTDNALYCWGRNAEGQLGDGTADARKLTPSAATLSFGGGMVFGVRAGGNQTCVGIIGQGLAVCWGGNSPG